MRTTDNTLDQANISWTTNNTNWLPMTNGIPWVLRGDGTFVPPILGGSGDPSGDPPAGDPPAGTPDPTSGSTDDEKTKNKGDDEKKFSQEDLNRVAAAEASKAARGKVDPKALGFDSAKALEEFLAEQKKKTEEEKTEADKEREAEIEAAKKAATDTVLSTANARIIKSEFLLAAMSNGLTDKEAAADAYVLAQSMEIWEGVEIDDEGKVSGFDDAFFKTLKEKKAYLFKGPTGTGDAGAGAGSGNSKVTDDEQALKDRYSGLPNY